MNFSYAKLHRSLLHMKFIKFLLKIMKSIFSQKYLDYEFWYVDQCSSNLFFTSIYEKFKYHSLENNIDKLNATGTRYNRYYDKRSFR